MAKFVKVGTTGGLEEEATVGTSGGAGDAGKVGHLDSSGKYDISLMPAGIGADSEAITTSEALVAGDFVNIWDSTGQKCRKADASDPNKRAHGYVKAGFASGAVATVFFEGQNNQHTGLTIGGTVWLSSATPGRATTSMPTATAGHILQELGVAVNATTINVEVENRPIKRA